MFVVKCKQLVEDEELSNSDDRADFALGKDGVYEYKSFPSDGTAGTALTLFHDNVPIGCLEDYEVWVEDENGNKLQD